MTIVLRRVDERLIHGQVVIGWGSQLHPTRYVIVDDDLAGSGWEQDLYRLAVSDGATVVFLTVLEARALLQSMEDDSERTILLTRDVGSMVRLARQGALAGRAVNLGGMHFGEGRTRVRSYLFLSEDDREGIRELAGGGATVTARDLPDSAQVTLDDLIGADSNG
ncbi:MAG TPA: PTS sugar transporter subunit IIB [Longimicrobiales bacterium]